MRPNMLPLYSRNVVELKELYLYFKCSLTVKNTSQVKYGSSKILHKHSTSCSKLLLGEKIKRPMNCSFVNRLNNYLDKSSP